MRCANISCGFRRHPDRRGADVRPGPHARSKSIERIGAARERVTWSLLARVGPGAAITPPVALIDHETVGQRQHAADAEPSGVCGTAAGKRAADCSKREEPSGSIPSACYQAVRRLKRALLVEKETIARRRVALLQRWVIHLHPQM